MSKITFVVAGKFGAPTVDVALEVSDYYFGDGAETAEGLETMHNIAREVERVIGNRLSAMHHAHLHAVKVKQDQAEAEQIKQMRITALEDELADLKGEGPASSPTAVFR